MIQTPMALKDATKALMNILDKGLLGETDKDLKSYLDLYKFKVTGSVISLLKTVIVEPNIIITKEAYQSDSVDDVINLSMDMFASFYIQAFEILTKLYNQTDVAAVNVLSTNKNEMSDLILKTGGVLSNKANQLSLDQPLCLNQLDINSPSFFLNQEDKDKIKKGMGSKSKLNVEKTTVRNISLTINSKVKSPDGKLETISVQIPMTIIANVAVVDVNEIVDAVTDKDYRSSFTYRWNEYRSGALSLSDLVFCSDLVNNYKKKRLGKKEELLGKLNERTATSDIRTALTGSRGAEISYNTIIMSNEDVNVLNRVLNADITTYNKTNKFLSDLQGYSLAIMDEDTERLYLHLRDIKGKMDVGYKKLKNKTGKESDILDIMKYIMADKMPSL